MHRRPQVRRTRTTPLQRAAIVFGVIVFSTVAPIRGVVVQQVQQIFPSPRIPDDWFGDSVAVSEGTVVVGARKDQDGYPGLARVFVPDDTGAWVEQARLEAPAGVTSFGRPVSVSQDTAVVCAHRPLPSPVYVFVRDAEGNWTEQAGLQPPTPDFYCASVSISEDTVVFGAPGDDENGENAGAAYVFVRGTDDVWTQQAKLFASDGIADDSFGVSVSVSGDTAVVGITDAYGPDVGGAAYVFVRGTDGTWSEQAKLQGRDPFNHDQFGWSVAVSGDTVVVGAAWDQDNGYESGAAYVFTRDGNDNWTEQAKLLASDGNRWEEFGYSVAVSGDTIVIGAPYSRYDDVGFWTGSAYVFSRNASGVWREDAQVFSPNEPSHESLGWSVAVSGDTAVVGAPAFTGEALALVFRFAPSCEDGSPPECGDACMPGAACMPNTVGDACVCEPLPCEESAYPDCAGECVGAAACVPDDVLGTCICESLTPCADMSFPQCDGFCEEGEWCANTPGSDLCACVPLGPSCLDTQTPVCDGWCPPDEMCIAVDEGVCRCRSCSTVVPDGVTGVHFLDPERFRWDALPCAAVYNVYRATLPSIQDQNHDGLADDYGSCFLADLAIPEALDDTQSPAPGFLHSYLVTGENAVGEGTFDLTSDLLPRGVATPCP